MSCSLFLLPSFLPLTGKSNINPPGLHKAAPVDQSSFLLFKRQSQASKGNLRDDLLTVQHGIGPVAGLVVAQRPSSASAEMKLRSSAALRSGGKPFTGWGGEFAGLLLCLILRESKQLSIMISALLQASVVRMSYVAVQGRSVFEKITSKRGDRLRG